MPVNKREKQVRELPALWKKMSPADHYHRITTSSDPEAWEHLAELIYALLKKNFGALKINRQALSIEDQVQRTLLHILERIKTNRFKLDDPDKFYGLLKITTMNCLRDVLRHEKTAAQTIPFESMEAILGSTSIRENLEYRILRKMVWDALLHDIKMGALERRALELSWLMNNGFLTIKNDRELAGQLSAEFEKKISVKQIPTLIFRAKQKLTEILRERWQISQD